MRNRMPHGHFAADLNIVWETVESSLADLQSRVAAALRKLREHEPLSFRGLCARALVMEYLWHLDGMLIEPRLTYVRTGSQYAFDNANNITAAGAFDAVNYPAPQPFYSSGGNVNIPAYGVLNFSTSFDFPTSWIDGVQDPKATIEVDNLADKKYNSFEYITSGGLFGDGNYGVSSAGAALAFPGAPRTWYLTLTADF